MKNILELEINQTFSIVYVLNLFSLFSCFLNNKNIKWWFEFFFLYHSRTLITKYDLNYAMNIRWEKQTKIRYLPTPKLTLIASTILQYDPLHEMVIGWLFLSTTDKPWSGLPNWCQAYSFYFKRLITECGLLKAADLDFDLFISFQINIFPCLQDMINLFRENNEMTHSDIVSEKVAVYNRKKIFLFKLIFSRKWKTAFYF